MRLGSKRFLLSGQLVDRLFIVASDLLAQSEAPRVRIDYLGRHDESSPGLCVLSVRGLTSCHGPVVEEGGQF